MTKRTQKAGIVGKYGTRYGGALRKISKKYEVAMHLRYVCPFCGKQAVKRQSVGIWRCRACFKTTAGGAWTPTTNAGQAAKGTLQRLKKLVTDGTA